MPLHLLPKKSWHVYNTAAIERVRRDEAAAAAASEAAEQRMQENDAERRMALLRGEEPPPLLHAEPDMSSIGPLPGSRDYDRSGSYSARKRKRFRGEDETDAEMRFAKEDFAAGEAARERLVGRSRKKGKGEEDRDALPLVDEKGHLQLFSAPAVEDEADARSKESGRKRKGEKGAEKQKQNEEEMGAMHFRDAAGRGSHGQKPWYASAASSATVPRSSSSLHPTDDVSAKADKGVAALEAVQDKDVWGNDDPRRRERESTRLASSDPFAAMQRAQQQLKQSERDREEWKRERLREVEPADEKERRTRKRGHRRDREGSRERRVRDEDLDEDDGLEGFSLDAPPREERDTEREKDRERRSHHHHRRHRREDERHRRREDDRHHRRHRER